MFTNRVHILGEQLAKLRLRKPQRVVLEPHLDAGLTVLGLVDLDVAGRDHWTSARPRSNLSLESFREIRLRTTCLYSDDSTEPRRLLAVCQRDYSILLPPLASGFARAPPARAYSGDFLAVVFFLPAIRDRVCPAAVGPIDGCLAPHGTRRAVNPQGIHEWLCYQEVGWRQQSIKRSRLHDHRSLLGRQLLVDRYECDGVAVPYHAQRLVVLTHYVRIPFRFARPLRARRVAPAASRTSRNSCSVATPTGRQSHRGVASRG